jgi:hypothetical protein
MSEDIKNPKEKLPISVYPDTWKLVNGEKKPRESMDDVLCRVFKELDEFRIEKIRQAEKDIIDERLEKILGGQ